MADNKEINEENNENINEENVIEDTANKTETENDTEANVDDTDATVEAAAVDNEEGGDDSSEKKGFFKKDKKKDKKDEPIEELNDKYKRTFAEFDNFRKRSEKEKAAMYEIGAKDIIEKILPVVDNFDRAFANVTEENMSDPFVDGMDKIYKQLLKTLEDLNVKEIDALGKEFNPDYHNAIMHVEDENLGDNEVAEVLLKGYTYRDSVVRHSMVKVAN